MNLHLTPIYPVTIFSGEHKAAMETSKLIFPRLELKGLHILLIYPLAMSNQAMEGS